MISQTPSPLEVGRSAIPSGKERRQAVRYLCGHRTMLQPISLREVAPLPVQVRDISATGLGLVSRVPLALGTFISLELQSMLSGTTRRLRARVIHTTRQRNGSWLLGCMLADELESEELHGLL